MFSKICINRPVTTIMSTLIIFISGLFGLLGLKLELMPSMEIPVIIVNTTYFGAGPSEIEKLITEPLENILGTVSNVKRLSSTSSSNSSMIIVEFEDGTDIDMASIDMREKIDIIKDSLPEDTNEPSIIKMDTEMMSAIMIGISSDKYDLIQLNKFVENNMTNRLKKIEGIASVSVTGGIENEIEIKLIPEKMQGYGLSESNIIQLLSSENINYPVGTIEQGTTNIQIKTIGEFNSINDIKNLPIITPNGGIINISDIAEVNQINKDMTSLALINGEPSIIIIIQKESLANIVDISKKIEKEIQKIQSNNDKVLITMLSDTSSYITSSINNIIFTSFQAAIMAIIVLFIFLRNFRTSIIIGISIPTSIFATFGLMYICNISMNIISMGGIAIGIGMLVDNSVVVLENIFKHWKNGEDSKKAALVGASEVSMAITASTLTTVAVFLPLIFVKGTVGQIFKDLSLTITFSLFTSLIIALTFIPMACSKILKRKKTDINKRNIFLMLYNLWGNIINFFDLIYKKILFYILKIRIIIIFLFMIAFIFTVSLIPNIGIDFMPNMDQGVANIEIELPKGTKIEETENVIYNVLDKIDSIKEIKTTYVTVGGGITNNSTDNANITINMISSDKRNRSTDEIVYDIKQRLNNIAGCKISVSSSNSAMGNFGGNDISIMIKGDDNNNLKLIVNELINIISKVDGIIDIKSSSEESVSEASIIVNRDKASLYGITSTQISNTINTAISGTVVTKYKINGTEIDIRIRHNKDDVRHINDIKNIKIISPKGAILPLSEIADIKINESLVSITRDNQQKYISITANIKDRAINEVQSDLKNLLDNYQFPDGYFYQFSGTMESMIESYVSLIIVFIISVLLVYMIMASQFESLIYPFIVLFSIPLAITGGILGLFINNNTITITAFMGFIMLSGMVVNNAIVLVDYTNQILRIKNCTVNEALMEAGPNRLRPILMTTLTTILGLIPMAIGKGEGMEMQQPLAITVIFGLGISTIVTLVFIPVLYSIISSFKYNILKLLKK